MPQINATQTVALFTSLMAERLTQAAALAKSAATCSAEGNPDSAVQIALDIEQPLYEVTTLLNAMSLINRLARE